MDHPNQHPSDVDRLIALKALREYMYLHSPVRHGMADFVEDIPKLRPYGMFTQDALPSQSVIDHDPKKRHHQIQQAMQSIERLHSGKSDLPMQTLRGGAAGAIGSIPLSLLFGGATRALTHGKGPVHAFSNPAARGALLSGVREDVTHGVALGGAMGAAAPIATHQVNPSHRALREAADILQEAPYLTGLPGGDITAAMNYKKKESKPYQMARSGVVGAGVGALAGASGGALSSGMEYLSTGVGRKFFGATKPMPRLSVGNMKVPSMVGAGLGAGFGLLTSALQPDSY